jgi:hypothetical protein
MRSIQEITALRRAVDRNCFKGGPSVFAKDLRTGTFVRIIGVRLRRGILSGRVLNTGKWTVIVEWETR